MKKESLPLIFKFQMGRFEVPDKMKTHQSHTFGIKFVNALFFIANLSYS